MIVLFTGEDNVAARKLYEKVGMKMVKSFTQKLPDARIFHEVMYMLDIHE